MEVLVDKDIELIRFLIGDNGYRIREFVSNQTRSISERIILTLLIGIAVKLKDYRFIDLYNRGMEHYGIVREVYHKRDKLVHPVKLKDIRLELISNKLQEEIIELLELINAKVNISKEKEKVIRKLINQDYIDSVDFGFNWN